MRFTTAGKEGLATVIGVQKVCRIIRVEGLLHLMDSTLHYFFELLTTDLVTSYTPC